MRVLKRVGASLLSLGVVAAGMVMTAPIASAHTGTLETSAVCQSDFTYKITYTGTTTRVPESGVGNVATLTVGEILPAGTTVTDAPATVTGNTTYTFTQIVPGTAKRAQATAFLVWGDGVTADPIGQTKLEGDCSPPVVAPTGSFTVVCSATGADVTIGTLSSGTRNGVVWTLTVGSTPQTVTSGQVVAVPALSALELEFTTANGYSKVVQSGTAPAACPPVVAPTGSFTVVCSATGANVTIGTLSPGTGTDVVWTLTYGSQSKTVSTGDVVPVPASSALALTFTVNGGPSQPAQSGTAPEACTPPVVVAPTGSFTVVCSDTGANVTIGTLSPGTGTNVVWTLTYGSQSKTVSTGDVVAVPASSPLALTFTVNGGPSQPAQSGTAPEACAPVVVPPSGSFTVVCSATGGTVTVGTLGSGTRSNVVWTLAFGSESKTVNSGDVVAVPALAALALKYTVGGGPSTTAQTGTAPAACVPAGTRSLGIVKSVSPTGDAQFGDTLTYTLKVTAGGTLGQSNVAVSDYIPGYKPGRDSDKATYVPGSAACDAGTCTAAYDASAKLITWGLGDMAPGTSRMVTFQVTIDTPTATVTGGLPAVTIFNSGAVSSTQTSTTPSNEVQTPVTAVLAVKRGNKPPASKPPTTIPPRTPLPHTGAPGNLPWTLGAGALLLMVGSALIFVARKPQVVRVR